MPMTSTATLEHQLTRDLGTLEDRASDERLMRDLYRALANNALAKRGDDGHLSLSWQRAEDIVNTLRTARGLSPLEGLAQSGGEGALTERAREILERLGWTARPRDTGEHDERHESAGESPPPADPAPPEWERRAHEEAEASRHTPPKL